MKLNSKQLRDVDEAEAKSKLTSHTRNPLYLIVENVYDTYNVGGLFRLADALNVSKVYLCGETEIPPNHKIVKASIGTYKIVPWVYKATAAEAIEELRNKHIGIEARKVGGEKKLDESRISTSNPSSIKIVAVEQAPGSVDYRKANYEAPVALLVGNETSGVTEETLRLCDQIVEIPMWGINKSLNVIVSAAIVGYLAAGAFTPES